MNRLPGGTFFGETERLGRFGQFTITASRYRAGERLPHHCHENAYLFVMTAGSMTEHMLGRDIECSRGWLIFNEAGESHQDHVLEVGAEGLNVELPARWLTELREANGRREPVAFRHAGPAVTAIGWLQLALARRSGSTTLGVEEAVVALLGELVRVPNRSRQRPNWLDRVEEWIRSQPCGQPALDAAAAMAGVHPAHLCREFRRAYGCTMSQYSARLRADAALQAVMTGDSSLSAIAVANGYADQSHMTRSFCKHFRMPPGRLRRIR